MEGKLTRDLAIERNNVMQGVIITRTLILIQWSCPTALSMEASGEAGRNRAERILILPDGVASQKVNYNRNFT